MKKYFPVKINNISSSLCVINLLHSQNLHLKIPYNEFQLKIESDFLKLANKQIDFFEIFQEEKTLRWNHSNLYLGNLNVFSSENKHCVCVFLDLNSKISTIINPKNSRIKINSNQIIELILFSKSKNYFNFEIKNGLERIGYSVFENEAVGSLYDQQMSQHHIWFRLNNFNVSNSNLFFYNEHDSYNFYLEIKNKTDNELVHYARKVRLIRKTDVAF